MRLQAVRSIRLVVALSVTLASGLATGCGDSGSELFVELKTDFVPGGEFTRVRTTLVSVSGAGSSMEQDREVSFDDDFLVGSRVAELTGVTKGEWVVRVALLDAGRQIIERNVRVTFAGSTAVTVLITRNCENVTCPGDGDAAVQTECLGGRCVSPDCGPQNPEACGAPACEADEECGALATCARALCEEGVCLRAVVVGACAPTEWCDPDVGCVPRSPDGMDGGVGADGGAFSCGVDADCADDFDCTDDACVSGACVSVANDALCTEASGGMCIAGFGCQYDGCTPTTCASGSACERARCEGDRCVIESACGAMQMCCAGACVAMGCDDGEACTDDACGISGCEHVANAAICDDGVFCNGPDTCAARACTTHAGNPCPGMSTCQEASDTCTGCGSDADCPGAITGPWGGCGGFSGTCGESGTRSRTVTSYACVAGTCVAADANDSEACSRDTDGLGCGMTTFGAYGACTDYSGTCDESGTRTRTRTDRVCVTGTCANQDSPDVGACSRDTDGAACGSSTYSAWSACGSFANVCDESGTQSRTRTDLVCAVGTCGTAMVPENQACSRDTDGTTCGSTSYGAWGACGGFSDTCDSSGTQSRSVTGRLCVTGTCSDSAGSENQACTRVTNGVSCSATTYTPWGSCGGFSTECDESGTQSRTRTDFTCMSDVCGSTMTPENQGCSRMTNGLVCEDWVRCAFGTCASGTCDVGGATCGSGRRCCEPGICILTGSSCP